GLFDLLVVVHIEFPADKLPNLRVAIEKLGLADPPGAKPAILGRVFLWVCCEEVSISSTSESPVRPRILICEFLMALDWPPFRKVGDRVIPSQCQTAERRLVNFLLCRLHHLFPHRI